MEQEKYPHKILIVEDDEVMLETLTDNLHAAGFGHIIKARDGSEGLELATTEKPDIILLDIILPKMDGMSMLTEFRKRPEGKDIKVVLLTNLNADDTIMSGVVSNSPSFYLVKAEHSIDDVVNKVKETLGV